MALTDASLRLLMDDPDYLTHLRTSALTDATIVTAQIEPADPREMPQAYTHVKGLKFPFFDEKGEIIVGAYRIRLLHKGDPKYHQPDSSGQHVYLPPVVKPEMWQNTREPLVIAEGEKKSLCVSQFGIPCLGVTGVYSWIQRKYIIPASCIEQQDKENWMLTLDPKVALHIQEQVAEELLKIDITGRRLILTFDSDAAKNPNVQDGCFDFGIWLVEHGAYVVQAVIPELDGVKTGVDDFIIKRGIDAFRELISDPKLSFPHHSNVRKWMRTITLGANKKRDKPVTYKMARAILADLDAHGARYVNRDSGEHYYLGHDDLVGRRMHAFRFGKNNGADAMRESEFGRMMIDRYFIDSRETDLYGVFADQYTIAQPIVNVQPRRVCITSGDALYFQMNDTQMMRVNGDPEHPFDILNNGDDNVLFYSNVVEPIDVPRMVAAIASMVKQKECDKWIDTLGTVRLMPMGPLKLEETRMVVAAALHLIPWFRLWRGMQLPIFQILGEYDSGKSYFGNFWRGMLTGRPSLDAITKEPRDFYGLCVNAPALAILDNVNHIPREVRGIVNDTIAKLVTDPEPHIDNRLLFKDINQVGRWRVDCTFALTAVSMPFSTNDLIQRSFIMHMQAIPKGQQQGNWFRDRMEQREEWIASHLLSAHHFLRLATEEWNPHFYSSHRLAHFEQALMLMLRVLGVNAPNAEGLAKSLRSAVDSDIMQSDVMMTALRDFGDYWSGKYGYDTRATIKQIFEWGKYTEGDAYGDLAAFASSVALGRYLQQHAAMIESSAFLRRYQSGSHVLIRVLSPDERGKNRPEDDV